MPQSRTVRAAAAAAAHELGLTLTLLRCVRGWNQEQLAKASGVLNSSVSDYLRGRKLPEIPTLKRLLDAMGFPLAAVDVTRSYLQALHNCGGATTSLPAPSSTAPVNATALRWEIQQAAPDLGIAIARIARAMVLCAVQDLAVAPPDEGTPSRRDPGEPT
jgi:transcriptional regulator with XRE-family HTH domain